MTDYAPSNLFIALESGNTETLRLNEAISPTHSSDYKLDNSPNALNTFTDYMKSFKTDIRDLVSSDCKTEIEAQLIYNQLKDLAFFQSFKTRNPTSRLKTEDFIELCQFLKLEKHPAKKVLCQEGGLSDGKLYILHSGSVIRVKKDLEDHIQEVKLDDSLCEEQISVSTEHSYNRIHPLFDGPSVQGSNMLGSYGEAEKTSKNLNSKISTPHIDLSTNESDGSLHDSQGYQTESQDASPLRRSIFARTSCIGGSAINTVTVLIKNFEKGPGMNSITPDESPVSKVTVRPGQLRRFSSQKKMIKIGVSFSDKDRECPTEEKVGDQSQASGQTSQRKLSRRGSLRIVKKKDNDIKNDMPIKKEKDDLTLIELVNKYGKIHSMLIEGEFFGEQALFNRNQNELTAITQTSCEFFVLSKQDFQAVMEKYDAQNENLFKFLSQLFPEIANITSSDKLALFMNGFPS